jgi:hypothetical protein
MAMRDWRFQLGFASVLALIAFAFFAGPSRADWDGPTSPELQAWFKTVQNAKGEFCCDKTEIARVDDYQFTGGGFDVIVDGVSYRVPMEKAAREANRVGGAIVWFYPKTAERTNETLRCFMRGMEG